MKQLTNAKNGKNVALINSMRSDLEAACRMLAVEGKRLAGKGIVPRAEWRAFRAIRTALRS